MANSFKRGRSGKKAPKPKDRTNRRRRIDEAVDRMSGAQTTDRVNPTSVT